jgi:hypothetical protein
VVAFEKKAVAGSARGWSFALLAVWVCLGVGSGCRTADIPPEARFASVEIRGNTPGQIAQAAAEVFREEGYEVMSSEPDNLIFEKKASGLNNFAYGNWTENKVWVRVNAAIVPVSEMTFRLQCQAHLLRDRGEPLEEEIKVSRLRRGGYQKLLDEVSERLRGRPNP